MYRPEVPRYVVSDLLQQVRLVENQFLERKYKSSLEKEQLLAKIIYLHNKLSEFADGSTKTEHLQRAQQYERALRPPALVKTRPSGSSAGRSTPSSPNASRSSSKEEEEEEDSDRGKFLKNAEGLIRKTKVEWDQIAGLQEPKASIISSMRLFFMEKPEGIKIDVADKFLLWGPPGTGKTLLASAAAAANGMTFFEVGVSRDLLSKWVGDSPKILSAVYEKASEKAPSIVFLDEVTLLVAGAEGQHEVSKQLHDTFLTILDGFGAKSEKANVMTIATTNRPWELSEAMKSRFTEQIYVPLPDAAARTQILKLETKGHAIDFPLEDLVKRTNYYSGRDLKNLCGKAVSLMLREANPSLTSTLMDHGHGGRVRTAALTRAHFDKAFQMVLPVTGPNELKKFDEYSRRGT